jgi:hypothetical protein
MFTLPELIRLVNRIPATLVIPMPDISPFYYPSDASIDEVWRKGRIDLRYDPNRFRQDTFGTWMQRSEYGKTSDFGWEIDHMIPVAKGGGDHINNLQPLHWRNNRRKADN